MAISYFGYDVRSGSYTYDERKSQKTRESLLFFVNERSTIRLRMRYKCIDAYVVGTLKAGKALEVLVSEHANVTIMQRTVSKVDGLRNITKMRGCLVDLPDISQELFIVQAHNHSEKMQFTAKMVYSIRVTWYPENHVPFAYIVIKRFEGGRLAE